MSQYAKELSEKWARGEITGAQMKAALTRNVGAAIEAEGMTVYPDENGEPVFCVLDRGARRKSSNLTRYTLAD